MFFDYSYKTPVDSVFLEMIKAYSEADRLRALLEKRKEAKEKLKMSCPIVLFYSDGRDLGQGI